MTDRVTIQLVERQITIDCSPELVARILDDLVVSSAPREYVQTEIGCTVSEALADGRQRELDRRERENQRAQASPMCWPFRLRRT